MYHNVRWFSTYLRHDFSGTELVYEEMRSLFSPAVGIISGFTRLALGHSTAKAGPTRKTGPNEPIEQCAFTCPRVPHEKRPSAWIHL